MSSQMHKSPARLAPFALLALPLLGGCNMIVLHPAGDVARQQGDLVVMSTALMLLIILPVMALTGLFAWRYRAANTSARYEPDWDHSASIELVVWAAPLLIIICLGALTWVGTHLLDPYRPLSRTAPGKPIAANEKPLTVEVVALDWKWLFILPDQGIATVNELALPVGRQVRFRISASSVMNSFYIPALAGQIYAMPGMETRLHAVLDTPGNYEGFSANYSGAGFSNMRFAVKGVSAQGFDDWVKQARDSGQTLDRATYLQLERPSQKVPVQLYAKVDPGLYNAILNMCVDPGKMCMSDMMALDAHGGVGSAGAYDARQLTYDKYAARGAAPIPAQFVKAYSATPAAVATRPWVAPVSPSPLAGAGLIRPDAAPRPARAAIDPILTAS